MTIRSNLRVLNRHLLETYNDRNQIDGTLTNYLRWSNLAAVTTGSIHARYAAKVEALIESYPHLRPRDSQ